MGHHYFATVEYTTNTNMVINVQKKFLFMTDFPLCILEKNLFNCLNNTLIIIYFYLNITKQME